MARLQLEEISVNSVEKETASDDNQNSVGGWKQDLVKYWNGNLKKCIFLATIFILVTSLWICLLAYDSMHIFGHLTVVALYVTFTSCILMKFVVRPLEKMILSQFSFFLEKKDLGHWLPLGPSLLARLIIAVVLSIFHAVIIPNGIGKLLVAGWLVPAIFMSCWHFLPPGSIAFILSFSVYTPSLIFGSSFDGLFAGLAVPLALLGLFIAIYNGGKKAQDKDEDKDKDKDKENEKDEDKDNESNSVKMEKTSLLQKPCPSPSPIYSIMTGVLVSPGAGFLILLLTYWTFLSMNPFWVSAPQVSKFETLRRYPNEVSLNTRLIETIKDLNGINITYPVIIKPNVCTTSSRGVTLCRDKTCIENIVKEGNQRNSFYSWVLQDYAENYKEAVVFFYKYPYTTRGWVKNVGIRQDADVKEDNAVSARYFPTKFEWPGSSLITPEFEAFFNDMASRIPGYNGGRFDVMFKSMESAAQGKDIYILETNVFPLEDIAEKSEIRNRMGHLQSILGSIRTFIFEAWVGISVILGGYSPGLSATIQKYPELLKGYFLCDNHAEALLAKP